MRVLTLEDGIIVSVKYMTSSYVLLENELVSDEGELGQAMLEDGTFEDIPTEQVVPQPTLEEIVEANLLETQYQTLLIEVLVGF